MCVADVAVRSASDRRTLKRVAKLARIVAPDDDVPRLRIGPRITERRKRDAIFGAPSAAVDLRRRVVEKIGREVFVVVRVVVDAVALNAARIDAQLHRRLLVVARIEQHGDIVIGANDRVALDVRRADFLRMRIVATNADVEILFVVGDPRGRLHLRLGVVAGRSFIEAVDLRRVAPAGVAQIAVDHDRRSGAMNLQRRWWRRRIGARHCCSKHQNRDRSTHAGILRTNLYVVSTNGLRFG